MLLLPSETIIVSACLGYKNGQENVNYMLRASPKLITYLG